MVNAINSNFPLCFFLVHLRLFSVLGIVSNEKLSVLIRVWHGLAEMHGYGREHDCFLSTAIAAFTIASIEKEIHGTIIIPKISWHMEKLKFNRRLIR